MEDSESDRTAVIRSSDSDRKPLRSRKRPRQAPSRLADDSEAVLRKLSKQQRFLYLVQIAVFVSHILVTVTMVGRLPDAAFLMVFHGVVSPLAPMLYVMGCVSALYGYLSVFRSDAENIPIGARARWFRRYMRWNKFFLATWFLATLGSVFGCWQFVFVQTIDDTFPRDQILKDRQIQSIIRLLIINLPEVLRDLTRLHNITAKTSPLDFVGLVGKYFYAFFFLATAFPAGILYYALRRQRRFYAIRFSKDMFSRAH